MYQLHFVTNFLNRFKPVQPNPMLGRVEASALKNGLNPVGLTSKWFQIRIQPYANLNWIGVWVEIQKKYQIYG